MNIVKNIDQYSENYVIFCDPIKNNVMNEGNFIRILYSTSSFVLNGIYLLIHLNEVNIEKYYNKYKCSFNVNSHKELVEKIKIIEDNLLQKINITHKCPQNKIYEQLKNGNIKIFSDMSSKTSSNLYLLKISGVWETDSHYGVTYKFSKISHP
jgi:Zn-dependent M16 (insulinase) family peptidase